MGYRIPRNDYTRPPATYNLGADIGKTIASGIAQYGVYRREQQKQAEQLAQKEIEFKNALLINQAKTMGVFDEKSEEALGSKNEMFKQFQGIVRDKARSAMDASVAMQFDKNLDDEQRAEYAKTVADFDIYTSASMDRMGGLIADYNSFTDPLEMKNRVVVGNAMNGERFFNSVTLTNLGGNGPAALNTDSGNFSRNVEAIENNNIVTSVVRLPKNHPEIIKNKEYIERGLEQNGGKYSYGTLTEEDGMYVFKSKIDMGAYATKDGFDFVRDVRPFVNGNEVMRTVNFLNDDGGITDSNLHSETYVTSGPLLDSNDNNTGKIETSTKEIVDISKLTNNKGFQDELKAEYAAAFGPSQSITQQAAYMERNLGIVDLPAGLNKYKNLEDFLSNAGEGEKEDFIKLALQSQILEEGYPQTSRKQYTDPKTTIQTAEGGLLDFLNKNNYLNEYGKPYQKGDNVFMIESLSLTNEQSDRASQSSDTEQRFNDWYDDPTTISQISLPNSSNQVVYNSGNGTWTISFRGTPQPGQDVMEDVVIDNEDDIKRYLKNYTSY